MVAGWWSSSCVLLSSCCPLLTFEQTRPPLSVCVPRCGVAVVNCQAIGASSVGGLHVGGLLGRYGYFLVGDAIGQMAKAEHDAKDGDLVLSPEAFQVGSR